MSQASGSPREDVLLGVGDDAAVLAVPDGASCVASIDSSVAGVHFLPDDPAQDIGYKTLAAALSDLAAMGAEPAWVMLSMSLPELEASWLEAFCKGFVRLIDRYQLQLIGGDLTEGPLCVTWQVMGFLPQGQALTRAGAQVGNCICVTGRDWGAAGLAVAALEHKIALSRADRLLVNQALYYPEPRIEVGLGLRGLANAVIDVSDGLMGDLSHITEKSGVGAEIYADKLPLSDVVKRNLPEVDAWLMGLTAGDEYELCFAIPAQNLTKVDCDYQVIGKIVAGEGVRVLGTDGEAIEVGEKAGYEHFK